LRYKLPTPRAAPVSGVTKSIRRYLETWAGRLLVVVLVVFGLERAGIRGPAFVSGLDHLALLAFLLYGVSRLLLLALGRFLWRIRTKLILSYFFIAVVPVVLISVFFLLAGFLFAQLVASFLVSWEVERRAQDLQELARATLSAPFRDETSVVSTLRERFGPTGSIYPNLSYAMVRHGKLVDATGEAPHSLPSWWKGPGFTGVVKVDDVEVLRAVWADGDSFLAIDVPLDSALFVDLETRTGIRYLGEHGAPPDPNSRTPRPGQPGSPRGEISGVPVFAAIQRTDWETGWQETDALIAQFQPSELQRRLASGNYNLLSGDALAQLLAAAGLIFLVVYCVALLVGFFLARSITTGVHALSEGTERLREGNFAEPIRVSSRDQLGDLADSFNLMAEGIEDLLREQAEKQRLEEELRIARQIQMSLLPQSSMSLPGLEISALCLPAAEVGGDYYDLLPLSDKRMAIVIADVSGKGTSAALYMAELKGIVLSLARAYDSPAKLLSEANQILAVNMDARSFITMTYAVVDLQGRKLLYARAGHSPLIYRNALTGRTQVLAPQGLGLGIDSGQRFDQILDEAELPLSKGDVLLLFTDGLSEAMNERAELFGELRLCRAAEAAESLSCEEIKERVLGEVRNFTGGLAQQDDITLVVLKVTEGMGPSATRPS